MSISSYLDVLSAHYDCAGLGSANLADATGGLATFSKEGTVPSEANGKVGLARGPCSGNYPGGNGFYRGVGGAAVWDTRVSQGFTACTLTGWGRLDGNTGDLEFASQARSAGANNTKQWMLRIVHQNGPTDDLAVLFVWNHVLNQFEAPVVARVGQGAMPTGEWMNIGFSVDLSLGVARIFLGVPSETTYFSEAALGAWNSFQATATDSPSVLLGIGSGNSTGGVNGDIDHISWYNGYAFDEGDFLAHYANGDALVYPSEYTVPTGSPTGKTPRQRARYYHWNRSFR